MKYALCVSLGLCLAGAAVLLGNGSTNEPAPPLAPATSTESRSAGTCDEQAGAGERTTVGATSAGVYHAAVGRQFDYALSAESATSVRCAASATPSRAQVEQRLTGTLRVTILDRRDTEVVAEVRVDCRNPQLAVAGKDVGEAATKALALDLAEPFLLRMGSDGNMLGCCFRPAMSGHARATVLALMAGLRLVVPDATATQWQVTEQGQSGAFVADYRRAPDGEISKEWPSPAVAAAAADATGDSGDESTGNPVRTDGQAAGSIDAELGWLEHTSFHQTQTLQLAAVQVESTGSFAGKIELSGHRTLDAAALHELGWDLPSVAWQPVQPSAPETNAVGERMLADNWRRTIGSATTEELIQRLLALLRGHASTQDVVQAELCLIWKLRLDADGASVVAQTLASGALEVVGADALLRALGAAATEPAQRVLEAFVAESGASEELRARAVVAMVQIEKPVEGLATTVLAAARGAGGSGFLRDTALLMVGTLASRGGEGEVLATLLGMESTAVADGRLDTWLHAVANSKSTAVADVAGRYLDHADEGVRIAALEALHDAGSADASDVLVRRTALDSSPRVLAAATQMLAARRDATARRATEQVLASGPDDLRAAALHGLGLAKRDAFARQMLQRAQTHDPNPQLRELARQLAES
ncbi:MAG: HEAT repeat domain-containing protein [Planctomycetota bacterium]